MSRPEPAPTSTAPAPAPAPATGPRPALSGTPPPWPLWPPVLVVTVLALTLAGRWIQRPPAPLAFGVALLPYLYGAAAAVLGLRALVAGSRVVQRGLLAASAGLLALGGLLWGGSLMGAMGRPPGEGFRMLTWNVQRLWGAGDESWDCVVDQLRSLDGDVLTLQEVSKRDLRRLAGALQMECVHTDYYGSDSEVTGGLGVCAAADFGLGEWRRIRFEGDRWYYLFAEIQRGERVFNLLAAHLQPYRFSVAGGLLDRIREVAEIEQVARDQGVQARELADRVERLRDPSILAGDFNSTRDFALHARLRRSMRDVWDRAGWGLGGTVKLGGLLPLRVDYIYATDEFAVVSASAAETTCSDHRPVVAELVLTAAQ